MATVDLGSVRLFSFCFLARERLFVTGATWFLAKGKEPVFFSSILFASQLSYVRLAKLTFDLKVVQVLLRSCWGKIVLVIKANDQEAAKKRLYFQFHPSILVYISLTSFPNRS